MNHALADIACDALIFDLDGTLWDTSATCAEAWNRLLETHAISCAPISAADVRAVTGLPHAEAIRRAFPGVSSSQLKLLITETEHADNQAIATHGGALFPSVSELVPLLARSLPLMIVSNCQSGYIETFLRWSGLGPHFTDFECWGNTQRPKAENLASVITRNGLHSPIFIGDTQSDCDAARTNQCRFIHAAYGFGNVSSADGRMTTFAELPALLR